MLKIEIPSSQSKHPQYVVEDIQHKISKEEYKVAIGVLLYKVEGENNTK